MKRFLLSIIIVILSYNLFSYIELVMENAEVDIKKCKYITDTNNGIYIFLKDFFNL